MRPTRIRDKKMEQKLSNSLGEKLISGSGKGSSAISPHWILFLIIAVVGIVLIIISTQMQTTQNLGFGVSRTIQHPYANTVFILGLIAIVGGFIETIVKIACITKTQINVYENGIEGIGVSKNFLFGAYTTKSFKLAYDQITSLDATNSSIIIHASGTQYRCYVKNISEIQNTIFHQRNNSRA